MANLNSSFPSICLIFGGNFSHNLANIVGLPECQPYRKNEIRLRFAKYYTLVLNPNNLGNMIIRYSTRNSIVMDMKYTLDKDRTCKDN